MPHQNENIFLSINKSWFSWIPTNIGYLNFNYIADEKSLTSVFGKNNFKLRTNSNKEKKVEILNTNLTDLNSTLKIIFDKIEVPSTAEIEFKNNSIFNDYLNRNQPSNITGYCNIIYKTLETELLRISSSFDIETNGKIEIKNISIECNKEIESIDLKDNTLINTILNGIYTLIKKISHGDNHHFQKIDTMIGVYTKFEPEQILTDLGFQIKRIDKFVKSNDDDAFSILYQLDKQSADIVADGFMSYISTFYEIFIRNDVKESSNPIFVQANSILTTKTASSKNSYIKYKNILNTVKSIKAGVNKQKLKTEKKKNKYTFMISLFALIAAYNILFSNIIDKDLHSSFSMWTMNFLNRDATIVLIGLAISSFAIRDYIYNYIIGLFRKAMSNPNKYTFIEIIILFNYLKKNSSDEILNMNQNQEKIKKIEEYINYYLELILYMGILSLLFSIFSYLGFNKFILIPIVILVFILGYKLFKLRNIHK